MRILIVEDDHRIANSIKKGLELESYATDVAYNGQDGFDLASVENYDVIILDRMLPGKDGLAVCRELRKAGIQTPILILTALGQTGDKIAGLDTGADDYLTKPFSFEELLARVRALSRRTPNATNVTLRVSDLELETNTFRVARGGTAILLSRKEFGLLEYLMRHKDQILSKDQIITHVWDYDSDILPNTIEVYIRNLRRKIDAPFPKSIDLIQTVRGFGYKISTH